MSELFEEIFADLGKILHQENQIYNALLEIAQDERKILIKGQPEEVLQNNKRKDTILMELKILEEGRLAIVKKLSKQLGISIGNLTIASLIERIHPDYQKQFSIQADNLKKTITELKKINNRNNSLLKHSLALVRDWMNLILIFGGRASIYTADGNIIGPERQIGNGKIGIQA